MIKEKKKKTKYNFQKTKSQILVEYFRTVMFSILFAAILTFLLVMHARNEMIKDIYANAEIRQGLDKKMAQEIIVQSNFLKDLKSKNYSVCIHAGELYETAGDYKNAQTAYELAVQKAKPGVYKPYYKLICALTAQELFDEAESVLSGIKDKTDKKRIKFKVRSYIVMGDKYYSIGKFLSAAKSYEKADFYYSKFTRKDSVVDNSIKNRIKNSYIQAADIMVRTGINADAVRYLKKAEKYKPDDFKIRYKLAIILSDSDPEQAVKYLEPLLDEIPQEIDYNVYNSALLKAATIADLDNRPAQAKYYRYKIHSIDMFVNRKVVYRNDLESIAKSFTVKKALFTYPLKAVYTFLNVSNTDIINLYADFVLTFKDKPLETVTLTVADRNHPLFANTYEPNDVSISFRKKIFTKKELENYTIKIYIYKDKKYKTFAGETKIPQKSFTLPDRAFLPSDRVSPLQ